MNKKTMFSIITIVLLGGILLVLCIKDPGNTNKKTVKHSYPDKKNTFISSNDAIDVVLEHTYLSYEDLNDLDIEFDYKYKKNVYEIDFNYDNCKYEYYIDAINGEIIYSFKEFD